MMQDALLRVVVVALGLLLCPRDDPGVQEEWDDNVTLGLQRHEETLLRGEEKLGEEMAPVREIVKPTDDKGPPNKMKIVVKEPYQSDPHVSDEHTSGEKDVTVSKPDSEEDYAGEHFASQSDTSQPLKFRSESQISLTTSDTEHEQQGNLLLEVRSKREEDILTGGFFSDPVGPQAPQHKPDESPPEVHTQVSENETSEKTMPDWQEDYLWYIWNTFSIISIIRFVRKYLRKNSMRPDESNTLSGTCITGEVPLPDSNTLQNFHSKYVKASSNNKWREGEFLEGFANDMVEAMRVVCKGDGGMVIEDCQLLDSCDLIVPFTPPEPYDFQCLLSNHQGSDLLPDMQVCGQIKLVEDNKFQNDCPCHSSGADDMVCLLHCENEKVQTKTTDVCEHPLCLKNTPFLSKSLVTRWFQSTIKQAWAQISHKYDFELSICYIDAPGALVVRFRSGKKLCFSMNPVVKFNSDAHFYITPFSPSNLDTHWTLSLTIYEDRLLQCLSKHLPENPCHMQTLEIAWFLHQRQTAMSAGCLLKFSHFKTVLFHMLLTKDPSQWKPSLVACRLRDLFDFMERSLEKKLLHNVFIGNPATQKIMLLPAEFTQAKPVNLFYPLVVQNCIYRNTVMHFQEMLRNTQMLINDHVGVLTGQFERNSVLKT
ncbi:inositol 1,4,5-trisphosphate receptor-interacting protein [Platichthys flesus]|uniref:inositol 1,4,5-trisphosphate receptor-interacting protein n=1 Tax=Platichthys flesus TaxID=8260 RepID=UPI002DB69A9A|nr:inositol 1,4,5-trisphosphate receptor-interacting protein [Platichthys flesus]